MKITQKDLGRLEKLTTQKSWTQAEKEECLALLRKYFSPGASFCLKCHSSVRILMKQLGHYYKNYINN